MLLVSSHDSEIITMHREHLHPHCHRRAEKIMHDGSSTSNHARHMVVVIVVILASSIRKGRGIKTN